MQVPELTSFYMRVSDDNRVTTTHISLYMALFELWNERTFLNPVLVTRRRLMDMAKISGIATYHKCIRDLHDFGYVLYMPSRNPGINSQVCMMAL